MSLPQNHYQTIGNASKVAATSNAKHQQTNPSQNWHDLCLKFVRTVLQVPAKAPRAIDAWHAVPDGHQHGWYNPPAGVPVFWSGGSSGAGHVALADGHGHVYSSDILRDGKVDLVPIATIHAKWGLTYLGWTESLNGVLVYETPAAPPAPPAAPASGVVRTMTVNTPDGVTLTLIEIGGAWTVQS